jgi:hypothetical protein
VKPNTNQQIWHLLSQDFSIQKDLKRGLLNTRALAKHLIEEHNLSVSLDAVISAIRRFSISEDFFEFSKELNRVLKEMEIFTRDFVASITIPSHSTPELFKHKSFSELESNFRVIKGKRNAKIFFNEKELKTVNSFFQPDKIIETKTDLAELRIVFPERGNKTPGLLSRILNELTIAGISVHDLVPGDYELIIYVNREELLGAHQVMLHLNRK